jgi:hypothetical protein
MKQELEKFEFDKLVVKLKEIDSPLDKDTIWKEVNALRATITEET